MTFAFERIMEQAKQAIKDANQEDMLKIAIFIMHYIEKDLVDDKYVVHIQGLAYNDEVLSIDHKQTCSQPSLVALMADLLELENGLNVLEIGTGCGYSAALTKRLIGKSGSLVTVEYIPELAWISKKNLSRHFRQNFDVVPMQELGTMQSLDDLVLVEGDGSMGIPSWAPFNRIYLTAGVASGFNPGILSDQLASDYGVLLYPEKDGSLIKEVYREGKCVSRQMISKVSFVPLVGENS